MSKLIEVKNLRKWFYVGKIVAGKREALRAVDGVSFLLIIEK